MYDVDIMNLQRAELARVFIQIGLVATTDRLKGVLKLCRSKTPALLSLCRHGGPTDDS